MAQAALHTHPQILSGRTFLRTNQMMESRYGRMGKGRIPSLFVVTS
jgi:hypothetical protein